MKAFITGATGFIGSHLVKRLIESHHQLFCLVRKITPACEQFKKQNVTYITGDITDKASVLQGMKGCDLVIHLAGRYTFWEPNNRIYTDININGTRNVMECALENKVSKVVHVSTVGIYGKPEDCPFTEESKQGTEKFCEYFRTKYEGEKIVWDMFKNKGLPVVIVYPTAVLGPGDNKATGQYIMKLIKKHLPATVFNDSHLTFVHVKDVAEIIVRVAEKKDNIGEKYIAGKHWMSFGEINSLVHEITGVRLPLFKLPGWMTMMNAAFLTGLCNIIKQEPPWGMSLGQMKVMKHGFQADGSKAERELGISYTPIRVALEEAIASYQK